MRWASWLFKAQWQSGQQLESWWGQARCLPMGALASRVTQGPASNQVHMLEKPAGRRGQQVEKPSTRSDQTAAKPGGRKQRLLRTISGPLAGGGAEGGCLWTGTEGLGES